MIVESVAGLGADPGGMQPVTGEQVCAAMPAGPAKDQCYKNLSLQTNLYLQQQNHAQTERHWLYAKIAAGVAVVGLIGFGIHKARR